MTFNTILLNQNQEILLVEWIKNKNWGFIYWSNSINSDWSLNFNRIKLSIEKHLTMQIENILPIWIVNLKNWNRRYIYQWITNDDWQIFLRSEYYRNAKWFSLEESLNLELHIIAKRVINLLKIRNEILESKG